MKLVEDRAIIKLEAKNVAGKTLDWCLIATQHRQKLHWKQDMNPHRSLP